MRLRTTLLATSLLSAAPAVALAQPVTGPYVSLGAGYNIEQSRGAHYAPTAEAGADKLTYRFGDGYTGQASFGFGFGNGFRAEIEGLYLSNNVNHSHFSNVPGDTSGHDEKYGAMVNVLYDIDLAQFGLALPVTPYVGVGAGYLWDHLSPFTTTYQDGSINRTGGTNGSFAYQGIVGIAYNIPQVPGLAVTGEYRFIGTMSSSEGAFQSTSYNATGIHKGNADFNDSFNHSFMLGLRYAFNTAPPPPPPAPVAAPPAPAPARTYLVFFDWDRSNLTDRAREIVAEAAQASTRVQTTQIEVNGYADNSSIHGGARGARYNTGLSVRRANSVKAELIKDGVPANVIDIHGYGEEHPLVPTGPNTREPQNRRVEIILH